MPDLVDRLLPRLRAHALPGLEPGEGFVLPDYTGGSLLNLTASICALLGAPLPGVPLLAPDLLPPSASRYRRIVLLVVDGLGLDFFQRYLAQQRSVWEQRLPRAALAPLTSLAPSTTATVLTSLWTGAGPLQHGILGYEVWLREFGVVANMISQSPASASGEVSGLNRFGFIPEQFMPATPLGVHLARHGADAHAFLPIGLARSGLSSMHLGNARLYPYRSFSDLWISLAELLSRQPPGPQFIYAYWPELDTLSHAFGPRDERVMAEFSLFSRAAEQLFFDRLGDRGLEDTLFLLTADHGAVETSPAPERELRSHPRLAEMLHIQPTGETRLVYLYPRPGKADAVRKYFEQAWPGDFALLPSAEAIRSGLFGPGEPSPLVASRVGDLVAAARGQAYLWWQNKENRLLGRHGGLSAEEMLVPLYALPG